MLNDLDPSGEAERQLGLLYILTVEGLRKTLERGRFWELVEEVDKVDKRRSELRTLLRGLVVVPKDDTRGGKEESE